MHATLPASVPGPVPPDDRAAWYAPTVRSQYPVSNGVVATVTEDGEGYRYRTREPPLSEEEQAVLDRVEARFEDVSLSRPRTRAGAVERVRTGLPDRLRERIDELDDRRPASRRRLDYRLLASLRSLGPLTPLALDERIQIADTAEDRLAVHTRDFAPAVTDLPADTPALERFLGERVSRKTVTFAGFDVPVTVVRIHLLGQDSFEGRYVVEEPDLFPGDRELIETVKSRILEAPPAGVLEGDYEGVAERARTLLSRRIGYRPLYRLTGWLPMVGAGPGGGDREPTTVTRSERIDALAYYVVRDLVGDGTLTIPMRDRAIRAIEANEVGGRIAVVFHRDAPVEGTRMPTTLSIETDAGFVDVARSLAAEGGVELSVERPTATVSLERPVDGGTRTMHCSVALPGTREREHVSIATERETPPTPVALVDRGQLSAALVAAIWTAAAAGGSVVFVGPVDADPTEALGAHAPFIPATERPVAIGPGSRQVDLPHETALAVPPTDDAAEWASRIERDALHPDVAVVAGLNSTSALERFGAILASGRPVFAAARIASRQLFEGLLEEAGICRQVTAAVDLVVELPRTDTDQSATGWVPAGPTRASGSTDSPEGDRHCRWEPLFEPESSTDGALTRAFLDRLEDGSPSEPAIERTVERRNRYVEYLVSEGATDRESLMSFLADLRTDEAATIERLRNRESK
jgi:type IV secretory pathway ATPase VirB11/archaellum biosynthesis ATPase